MEATATCSISAAPKALADHLTAVKPAVGTRSAISALAGVRIVMDSHPPCAAYLEATDMEVSVRRSILRELHSVTIGGQMDAVVSHADLAKAVKLFAKRESVSLIDGEGEVAVTDGKRTIKLRKLRHEDFPAFPAGDETHLLSHDGRELAPILERAGRFAAKDETRPILTGIAIHYGNQMGPDGQPVGVRVQATDSYRLADLAVPGPKLFRRPEPNGDLSVVNSPARGLLMAAKGMRKAWLVELTTTATHTFVRFGGETWAMRQIAGQFPNFRQLVPDNHEVTVTMPATELAGACDVAVAFARRNAPMALRVNGEVKVTGSTPDVADFEELLTGASYHLSDRPMQEWPGELTIGLNPAFVQDIAKVYAASDVTLKLISALRPALFVDGEDLYLLMPIRLNV